MSNFIYDKAKEKWLSCGGSIGTTSSTDIDLMNDNIKAVLVQIGVGHYVASSAHEFLSDILFADRVAISPNLTGKSITAGVFNCLQIVFAAVTGAQVGAIVLYKDTGTAATSSLIFYLDTMTGLPVNPNGGDLVFVPDTTTNKVFRI